MVQAILDNRKRLTRRTKGLEEVNKNPDNWKFDRYAVDMAFNQIGVIFSNDKEEIHIPFKANIGDVLWVRETFVKKDDIYFKYASVAGIWQREWKWKPSIFMPKEACRIFLRLKSIRVERLQSISEDDCKNEGVKLNISQNGQILFELGSENNALSFLDNDSKKWNFPAIWKAHWAELWCKINGRDSWNHNPFVWVYEFEQIEKPLDFIL